MESLLYYIGLYLLVFILKFISVARKPSPDAFILIFIVAIFCTNVIYASAPKPKIKEASNLKSKHKMEYQDCKALYRYKSLQSGNVNKINFGQLFKKREYKKYTYKGLKEKDSLETKQRIIALLKLSLEYQQAISQEKSKVLKELASTKIGEVSKADWYASAKKIRAYKLASKHFKPEFGQGLFASPQGMQQQLLNQTRTQQRIPNGMQTRSQVRKTLPPNFSNEPNKISAQIDSTAKAVFAAIDSLKKPTLDSFHFKLNPYAELFFRERIKPAFTWQTILPQGFNPATIEVMPGVRFLWTPNLSPTFHFIYRQGIGTTLQQIQFTYQGYGFQLGLRRKILEKGFLFAAWEGRDIPIEDNKRWSQKPNIESTCVLGLGYTSAINVLLLCDVKQLIEQRNYTAIRVQFNF